MQQVKIFKTVENELSNLETEINNWLASSKARILSITGNIAPQTVPNPGETRLSHSDVLFVVLYEVGND